MSVPGNQDPSARWRANPFYVLSSRPSATRPQLEREAQKLLAMLELRLSAAMHYPTPVGSGERDAQLLRDSTAALRDPEQRLRAELWATLEPTHTGAAAVASAPEPAPEAKPDAVEPWSEALAALGWTR